MEVKNIIKSSLDSTASRWKNCAGELLLNAGELNLHSFSEKDLAEISQLIGPIAVLGAGGFIGSHFVHQISQVRQDVYACGLGLRDNWRLSFLPGEYLDTRLVDFDITNAASVEEFFKKIKPQTVFNFCAYGAYDFQKDSERIHQVNVLGVLNVLKAAQKFPLAALVNAGSSSEYGFNCSGPSESDQLVPNSEYAVAKASAGHLMQLWGKTYQVPTLHFRIYSVYGPWESPERLVSRLVSQGLNGNTLEFVDPQISRDFVYIDDVLRGFVKAALQKCRQEPGQILNLGTGVQTQIYEVSAQAKAMFNLEGPDKFGKMPPRSWDLRDWYSSPKALEKSLGWKPGISFQEGLQLTKRWEQSFQEMGGSKVSSNLSLARKKISAVVACYRDEDAIPILYQRLIDTFSKCGVRYEIIFVNDGSPGGDEAAIKSLVDRDPFVIGITHSRNFGSQSAFLSGMELATGDAVVLFDGDLQDPPELMESFIAKWAQGFEVVYGERFNREGRFHMKILYRMFYRVFRFMADVPIPLDAGDFSLIDRKVVNALLKLSEKDFFLRGLRAWVGFKQAGVPYHRPERMFGRSTNSLGKNFWWAKKGIFSFSWKPLDYMQRLGLLVFLASCGLTLFYLGHYFFGGDQAPRGITTLVILLLALGGLQILSMSILGEYIRKIVEEVKERPRFIRSSVYRHKKDSF